MHQNAAFKFIERTAGRWTDRLVVINRDDYDAARALRIVSPGRLVFMPGIGVDRESLDPLRIGGPCVAVTRGKLGLRNDDLLLLMIAEFTPRKRHADAIAAFARLRDMPRVHLALAGTGPLLGRMKRLADSLGVAERVHFLGHRRDVPELIRASVATVLPSAQEGLPRSCMESLCLGVPVIGTRIRGLRDLIGEGAGLTVPFGDVQALSAAMRRLVTNRSEAEVMGARGRSQMEAYDIRHIIRLHECMYAGLLKENASSAWNDSLR